MPINLSNGQNFDIAFKDLPANYAMKSLDTATDHYNIGYVVSGDRKTILLDGYYTVHAGYVTIMEPYVYHRTVSISDNVYQRYQIKFSEEIVKPLIDVIGISAFKELNALQVLPIDSDQQPAILQQFDMMNQVYHSNISHKDLVLQGMLNRLIITLLDFYNNHEPHFVRPINAYASSLNKQIVDAIFYIEKNYMNNPSLSETAQSVYLSKYYFSRLFKEQIGSTFVDYLNNVKLHHARELLIKSDLSIAEIASRTGYPNGNYLCDVFKKYIHISPMNFRKLNKKDTL